MTAYTASSGERCAVRINERVYPAEVVSVERYGGRWVQVGESRQYFSMDEWTRRFQERSEP